MPNPLLIAVALAVIVVVVLWLLRRSAARATFERLVTRELATRGITAPIEDDAVALSDTLVTDGTIGLTNLWQACLAAPRGEWAAMIRDHFDRLFAVLAENEALNAQLDTFDFAAPLLRVRLAHDSTLEDTAGWAVHRVDLPGTVSYLVLDLPSTVRWVSKSEAEQWGHTEDALFARALDNVWMTLQPEITRLEVAPEFPCTLLDDESFFTSTHALFLDRYPGCVGERGALVAVPTRDRVLAHALDGPLPVEHARLFALLVNELADRGPGTVCYGLFWFRDGAFTALPYTLDRGEFTFDPPAALTAPEPVAVG